MVNPVLRKKSALANQSKLETKEWINDVAMLGRELVKVNHAWFLSLLHDDLNQQQGTGSTLISDSHKGILDVVGDWLANTEHRKCIRHVYANFKKKHSGLQLQRLFWGATSSIMEKLFYAKMDDLKYINLEAYEYLRLVAMNKLAVNLKDQITPTVRKRLEYLKQEQRKDEVVGKLTIIPSCAWHMRDLTKILNSLSPDMFVGAIYAKTDFEMWNDLKETYDKVDGSDVKQFDAMISLPPCTCEDAKHFEKHNHLIKLMQFLMGLDESYLAIRSNILTRKTLPLIKEAFAIISGEESLLLGPLNLPTVFAAKTFNNKRRPNNDSNYSRGPGSNSNSNNRGPNPNLKCTNCNKIGHTVDRCFELICYPTGYAKRNLNSNTLPVSSNNASADGHSNCVGSNNATTNISLVSLSNDHLSRLMSFLDDNGTSSANANMEEYTISLLSIHKIARDSKLFVGFDDKKCYIQDLIENKTILNSLSPDMFVGAIYAKTDFEMWNDLKETYDKVDGSDVKQFDAMISLPPCTCEDAKHFEKHNHLIKLMQFLMGLDESYLAIRSNILTRKTLPLIKEAFAIISGEESLLLGPLNLPTVFAAKTFNNKRRPNNDSNYSRGPGSNSNSNNRGPNPNLKCTNCNKIGHTVDRCFELICYPTGYAKRNLNSNTLPVSSNNASADGHSNCVGSNNATTNISLVSLSNDHLSRLMSFLDDNGTSSANANMEEYTISLLSIHKIARDSKLFVGFDDKKCYIQDLIENKTVRIGNQCNGLYMFDVDNALSSVDQNDDESGATSIDENTHPRAMF
nr:hypothetical protein [Tanacetum cinerariifolium]